MQNKLNVVSCTLAAVAGITLVCGLAVLTGEVKL